MVTSPWILLVGPIKSQRFLKEGQWRSDRGEGNYNDKRSDQSDLAISQGMQATSRRWKKQGTDFPPKLLEGTNLDF